MSDEPIGRRRMLKLSAVGAAIGVTVSSDFCIAEQPATDRLENKSTDRWSNTNDRVWLGGEFWANPMENWHIADGAAECSSKGGNRSVHSLVHQLDSYREPFSISVVVKQVESGTRDGGASIRIGIQSEITEYRSNCFVHKGIDAGIVDQTLVLKGKRQRLRQAVNDSEIKIVLNGKPGKDGYLLELEAVLITTGESLGSMKEVVDEKTILGNVAIVSNFSIPATHEGDKIPSNKQGGRYAFRNWELSGKAFCNKPQQKFGPVLWSMYTLHDSRSNDGFILKFSVLTGPLGEADNKQVNLFHRAGDGVWKDLGARKLDPDGWVATFKIKNWDAKSNSQFKLVYEEQLKDGSTIEDAWTGTIRANPSAGATTMAAMTCQKDYGFPYEPVAKNVLALDPDIVLFSGDQIYEDHGGFGMIRAPARRSILNYLRKLYQFGWAFREVMRDRPTICLPDDHDVLQGNLWGEGGADMGLDPAKTGGVDKTSGYIEPVRMVNAVHRTQTAHHPDPADPTPTARGMSVYYGELVYGEVGFAILGDRQWKSGPERIGVEVGSTGQDEEPQFINPDFDRDGLALLGKRQEEFLRAWSKDWKGQTLKAVLSQTVFAGISTHQPKPDRYLKYDFDSSGWPASGRNRAIEAMRDSMALHICGDTHLGTLSQYGVNQQRDSNWAFCTPAISAGWPRWWLPDKVGLPMKNRPQHGLPNTGEYLDSFGNKIYVYAVGNPVVSKSTNRYKRAHEKGSGFGFIEFLTKSCSYKIHAYRFLGDVNDKNTENQFPGWPVVIMQQENRGANQLK